MRNYLFTAKELDNATGLYYYGLRYYDPSIGRWYVPDALGQGWSPYVYCGNNPVNRFDPNGEWWLGAIIGAGVEYGIQVAQTGSWVPTKEGWARIGVSAAAGLATGGLSHLAKGLKAANVIRIAGTAAISSGEGAAKDAISGKDITAGSVTKDAILGGGIASASTIGKKLAEGTKTAKQLAKQARRTTNIANTGRPRPAQALRSVKAQAASQNYGSGKVATATGGVAAGVMGNITESTGNVATTAEGNVVILAPANSVSLQTGVTSADNTQVMIPIILKEEE